MVECEGLDYSITDKIRAAEIADPELRDAWEDAERALRRVEKLLDPGPAQPTVSQLPARVFTNAQLMVDAEPAMFTGAATDRYGAPVRVDIHGGTFKYVVSSSHKEVYIRGDFTPEEILDVVHNITPHLCRHIVQQITLTTETGRHSIIFNRRGLEYSTEGVTLDGRPLDV